MKDRCRICETRLVGNQCRWIFSPSGRNKLQVILSHILGKEVTRDGRGEFLCGKCVFQLEKVMKYDVDIKYVQEDINRHIQKLQEEKDHLIHCIIHVYNKNNPDFDKLEGETNCSKTTSLTSTAINHDDKLFGLRPEKNLQYKDKGTAYSKNRIRRCVSLDWIGDRTGLRVTQHRSQSMYSDLVHRRQSRRGFKRCSTSLQSLNKDFSSVIVSESLSQHRPKKNVKRLMKVNSFIDALEKSQARLLRQHTSTQPSIISDLIQLLCCICARQISVPAGSHIPVLRRITRCHFNLEPKHETKDSQWKTLHLLADEFDDEYSPVIVKKSEGDQQLMEKLKQTTNSNEMLSKRLENINNEIMDLTHKLEEKENELNSEKKNALKRDKTIQGLTQILSEKENEIAELCHEIEDRDGALSKARDAAHKAQLQKYQGVEEHQNLLMEKQNELALLQGEHHSTQLEAQKLQRALERKEQELGDLQQAKDQLEVELEDMQQQKKKGDKALNDLNNQLKKLNGDIKDRENSLEQKYQEHLNQTKQKVLAHEVTIQRLTSSLMDREQQLQEYINMIGELEHSKYAEGMAGSFSKLRQRLKDKDKELELALDEKFAAIEDKDNQIHHLQLSLREKERDLERINNLISHNKDTIDSLDSLIKEKDMELQCLGNTLKNLQRSKQDIEENLSRSLREKDSIINQLQSALDSKAKDLEDLTSSMLGQSQSHASDLVEQQMCQRLKVTEAMLAQAIKDRERLVADNESAVEGLLATINSKDQQLKESTDHYKRMMLQRTQEIEELRRQLCERQQHLNTVEKQCLTTTQEGLVEAAQLRALLEEKDRLITKLLQQEKDRDLHVEDSSHVLELRQTIKIMQDKLDEKEAEMSTKHGEKKDESIPLSKKSISLLKKELQQKNEALNKALKRETELKLLLNELEHRYENQAANVESLTATEKVKDENIETLHQLSGQKLESLSEDSREGGGSERFPPKLPQRERTLIGEDSEQGFVSSIVVLQREHESLNRALKKEQQLYSSLVRAVKDQDSTQRLHSLQLELTAVQLLRQQLEESIKTNEDLRDDLEKELQRAKLREGMDLSDPKELESMRNQLEDAHRWNMSLQARLGAIQNRAGGVGGTNDGHSLILIGDQTSYMSICVEEQDDTLSQMTSPELREKVIELQQFVSRQHASNRDLQNRLTELESDPPSVVKEELGIKHSWKQQPSSVQDKQSQTEPTADQVICEDLSIIRSTDKQTRKHTGNIVSKNDESCEEQKTNASLLSDFETSESCPKANSDFPHVENTQLQNLLKEQTSSETGAFSEISDDSLSPKSGEIPNSKCIMEKSRRTLNKADPRTAQERTERTQTTKLSCRKTTKIHKAARSRLPVLVRLRAETGAALEQMQNNTLSQCSDPHQDQALTESNAEIQQTAPPEAPAATNLELRQQQNQDKETLINELQEKLADFQELQVQLQEKERLNLQYTESLQAAETTIAYLTACSLDSQGPLGSNVTFQNKHTKLEQALREREQYIQELTELLYEADKALNLLKYQHHDNNHLSKNIKAILQRTAFGIKHGGLGDELQKADSDESQDECCSRKTPTEQSESTCSQTSDLQQQNMFVLKNCLCATEAAIASLAAHCISTGSSAVTSREVQTCLEKLRTAVHEKDKLADLSLLSTRSIEADAPVCSSLSQTKAHDLHHNLQVLYEAYRNLQQRNAELKTSLKSLDSHRPGHNPKTLPPNLQTQIETLHKELREKRKVCENLEEKLATAQSFITNSTSPGERQKALKRDEKGVQVDFQDLGYETSGKNELDREESSSTDLEVGFKPICRASSLHSVSKQDPVVFSSTENIHSVSSTYPTSSVLSSAKASLKSLRRSSLLSDVANTSEPILISEAVQRELPDVDGDFRTRHIMGNATTESRRSGRSPNDLFQSRSGSTSPARIESLIQSQARELSQLRLEIKETRRLGGLQRQQLEDLGKAFSNLIQSAKLDSLMGEEVKKQLDRSLAIMDSLEGRLDISRHSVDGETYVNIDSLGPNVTHRLNRELQEKNRLIQTLQGQNPSSHHSSHSDLYQLDQTFSSPQCSLSTSRPGQNMQHSADRTGPAVGGEVDEGLAGHQDTAGHLQGLQRENVRLQEQLRNSKELNSTLRSELDLRCTIMAQTSSQSESRSQDEAKTPAQTSSTQGYLLTPDLLAEHLLEIRSLRQRLEESIKNNDSLREQLEKKLAEVDKNSVTHILIQDHDEHNLSTKEMKSLLQQNQSLKDQLNSELHEKRKEKDRLRSKLEQSRKECETLRQENVQVQQRLELTNQEKTELQESLYSTKEELHRMQCKVKVLSQELSDSQHLLQSLHVELEVYEKLKSQNSKSPEESQTSQKKDGGAPSASVDLQELLSEIKHLRLQLERSIHTNTALRQKLEEQLSRGQNHSETININYLLSSSEEAVRTPGRDSQHLLQRVEQASVLYDQKCQSEEEGSRTGSSVDSFSKTPSRLVPGHRMWASRSGCHILGLIEDFSALRKQITEGHQLSNSMDTQLQEFILVLKQQCSDKVMEQQPLKKLCNSLNTLQQVLEEASRLLKLLWRVSLPVDIPAGGAENNQQHEQLKREISRLKNRVLQQEKMLSGAVKRLRTTNQLKEGMERVIIDQLSLTHGVLKKARGNLEEIPADNL